MKKLVVAISIVLLSQASIAEIKAPHKLVVGGDVFWNYDIHNGNAKKPGWVSYNIHFDNWVSYTESIITPDKRRLKISISSSPACAVMLLKGRYNIFRTVARKSGGGKMQGEMYNTPFGVLNSFT